MESLEPRDWDSGDGFRERMQRIVANRHSPEAAALYKVLYEYVTQRVRRVSGQVRLPLCEQEEVVGEVLLQLMRGGLATFRGQSLPELMAYVRTISDRSVWKRVRRRDQERSVIDGVDADASTAWMVPHAERPDTEVIVESPLSEKDQAYLLALCRAGSKAELARERSVSRAAVTQRVARIRGRIEALGEMERARHDVWIRHAAREVESLEE